MDFISGLIANHESARDQAEQFRLLWQEVAEYIMPEMANFTYRATPGIKRQSKVIDPAGMETNERFAQRIYSFLTGEGDTWFSLELDDDKLQKNPLVRQWLDECSRLMMQVFNWPGSNWATASQEKFEQIGAFGNAPVFIEERNGLPFFRCEFLGNCFALWDDANDIEGVSRQYRLTALQIKDRFGRWGLPLSVAKVIDRDPRTEFDVLHVVRPRRNGDPVLPGGHAYISAYVLLVDKKLLKPVSGYREMPWIWARWRKASNEQYGRGPGIRALADVKQLQMMARDIAKGVHKSVDPNILMEDDGTLNPRPNMNPGGIWYSNRGPSGRWGVEQVPFQGQIPIALEYANQIRDRIKKSYFLDAFELPPPVTANGSVMHMSATEFAGRQRQQMQFVGPILSRMRAEDLLPTVRRVFLIMARNGLLPRPPVQLRGSRLVPKYVSPLAIAVEAHESDTIMQFLGKVGAMAQTNPTAWDAINTPRTIAAVAQSDHVPVEILSTPEELQQIEQQRQQEQANAAGGQDAQSRALLAQAAKDNANAIQITGA